MQVKSYESNFRLLGTLLFCRLLQDLAVQCCIALQIVCSATSVAFLRFHFWPYGGGNNVVDFS